MFLLKSNPEMRSKPETAWEEYRQQMLRFILSRVSDVSSAEDIVQEVLVKAHANIDRLEDTSKLQPWLYQITRNAIVDYFRSKPLTEPLPPELLPDDAEPDSSVRAELASCLRPFALQLPERYREIILFTEFEEHSQQDAADHLGISLSAAKSRILRGRKMLRERLQKCCRIELTGKSEVIDYTPLEDDCECECGK